MGHWGSPQGAGSAKHEREWRGEVKEKEEMERKGEIRWTSDFTRGQGGVHKQKMGGDFIGVLEFQ